MMAQNERKHRRATDRCPQFELDNRTNRFESVQNGIGSVFRGMPAHLRSNMLKERRIKQIHEQFRQMAPQALLDQVNSVFLFRDDADGVSPSAKESGSATSSGATPAGTLATVPASSRSASKQRPYRLVVYVENSIAKAEFNARREMIRLKYQELFGIDVQRFDIKTSKADYRSTHPFRVDRTEPDGGSSTPRESYFRTMERQFDRTAWTLDGTGELQRGIETMDEGPLKESFKRLQSAMNEKSSKKR